MSRLTDAYTTLGVPQGSSFHVVKKRHRELVRQWHPDQHSNLDSIQEAEEKIKEINASYSYIKKVIGYLPSQKVPPSSSQRTRTSYQSYNSEKTKSHTSKKTTSSKQSFTSTHSTVGTRKTNKSPSISRSWFDRKITQFFSTLELNRLKKKKIKNRIKIEKSLHKENAYWKELRKKYDERTRVGLYRSFINAVIFGKFIVKLETPKGGVPGSYTIKDKYEIDLRHALILDHIFYSINKGGYIVLKYIIGLYLIMSLVYFTAMFYIYGMIGSMDQYMSIQFQFLGLALLLFIPDNILQRIVLWKYRHLEQSAIQRAFSKRTLPSPWNTYKHVVLFPKYLLLTYLLIEFHLSHWYLYYFFTR